MSKVQDLTHTVFGWLGGWILSQHTTWRAHDSIFACYKHGGNQYTLCWILLWPTFSDFPWSSCELKRNVWLDRYLDKPNCPRRWSKNKHVQPMCLLFFKSSVKACLAHSNQACNVANLNEPTACTQVQITMQCDLCTGYCAILPLSCWYAKKGSNESDLEFICETTWQLIQMVMLQSLWSRGMKIKWWMTWIPMPCVPVYCWHCNVGCTILQSKNHVTSTPGQLHHRVCTSICAHLWNRLNVNEYPSPHKHPWYTDIKETSKPRLIQCVVNYDPSVARRWSIEDLVANSRQSHVVPPSSPAGFTHMIERQLYHQ